MITKPRDMMDVSEIGVAEQVRRGILNAPCARSCRVIIIDEGVDRPRTIRECFTYCIAPGHAGCLPWDTIE